jgi:hypothetical protein
VLRPVRSTPLRVLCALLTCVYTVDGGGGAGHGHRLECPTVTLLVDKAEPVPGEIVAFTATVPDPDSRQSPMRYTWTTTAGALEGSGTVVTLDTTGLTGSITVTVTVGDADLAWTETTSVSLNLHHEQRGSPCHAFLGPCYYVAPESTQVSGACGAILDGFVMKLKPDPRWTLVIDGHADLGEQTGVALGRAEAAHDCIAKAGVDPKQIIVRSLDSRFPRWDRIENRRAEFVILPEGKTIELVDKLREDCYTPPGQPE